MQFWVVKGSTERNDWSKMLQPGAAPERWVTRRPPRRWREGDRVFFWESAPGVRIIGLGTLTELESEDADGDTFFFIRADTPLLSTPLTIDQLRSDRQLREATFLKSGAAGTVYPLQDYEARRLLRLVHEANPTVRHVTSEWGLSLGLDLASESPERKLTELCVYTIIAPEKLAAAARGNEPSERLTEGKRWAQALKVLEEAKRNREEMPIVFADSRQCVDLIAWGIIAEILLEENQTLFRVTDVHPLRGRTQQDLVVASTGERMINDIRPYRICRTPAFIG